MSRSTRFVLKFSFWNSPDDINHDTDLNQKKRKPVFSGGISMATYDILMLIIFGGAILFGAWKGLAWQIASLSAIVISYIVAINFREPLAALLPAEPPWNKFGAMLILFMATSLVVWLLFGRIKNSIKRMHLSGFDRQAGALLGAVKGALLCMVVTMFAVTLFGDETTQAVCDSRSGGYISRGINELKTAVPPEIHDVLDPYINEFNRALGANGEAPSSQSGETPIFGQAAGQLIYGGTSNADPANESSPANPSQIGQFNPFRQTNSNQHLQNIQGQWNSPQQPPNIPQEENSWPTINYQVNTEGLLNSGVDAAQRYFDSTQSGSNQSGSNRQ